MCDVGRMLSVADRTEVRSALTEAAQMDPRIAGAALAGSAPAAPKTDGPTSIGSCDWPRG